MRIGGIVDTSTVDWYGNVSMVVFFAGCNFRCPYCQNSGFIPTNSGEEVDLELIRRRISMNMSPVPSLDAVVFTGGEPTLQPEVVLEASRLVREEGLKLMLDTNGSRSDVIEALLREGLVDRVALDVKAPLTPEDYEIAAGLRKCGGVVESIRRILELCTAYGVEVEARTTVAPGVSDGVDFIRRIARQIKGHSDVYYLQQFDNTGEVLSPKLKVQPPPSRGRLMELAEVALDEGLEEVYIKTRELGLERVR